MAYHKPSPLFPTTKKESLLEDDPFGDSFPDPLCKLNLKETSDFVKAFPMTSKNSTENRASTQRRRSVDAPSTPGRPIFSFSSGIPPRKSIPSKWDDAEKWLISRSCHDSPAHLIKSSDHLKPNDAFNQKTEACGENMMNHVEQIPIIQPLSYEVLKDKFTDIVEPAEFTNFRFTNAYCEPIKESAIETASEVHRRDIGTEMTPTATRCNTPIKNASPARHNTPENRSGLLGPCKTSSIDISELQDCHFAKMQLSAQYDSMFSNWSSREEEESDISKSLRHSEMLGGGRKSFAESRALAWEDEERTKSCIRYQREEAKIQAWVNLQNAKAEAQSRKLEVKIQKMRANLEEKLSKRMAMVNRRAVEWRTAAQVQHSQHILKASEMKAQKLKSLQQSQFYDHASCACFPCNNLQL